MGNILKCLKGDDDDYYYGTYGSRPQYQPQGFVRRPQQQPLGPHGVTPATAGVAVLEQDLLNFEATSMVPEGLGQHVTSSKKAQAKWYRKILEAYKDAKPPPKTPAEAARLLATALSSIQPVDLEGVLEFYGFPIPVFSAESSDSLSSLPEGVQFVLNTLPVNANCIGDGDGFTAYVDTADPRESANVPLEVHEAVIERAQARNARNYQRADALQKSINEAGYKIIIGSDDEEILARKYRIRMRGIDAPELKMPYGKESKNALVKLIAGKSVKIYVYGQDKFLRYVGDIYCNGVFIQEQMLKAGFAWHFKNYDKRPEFAQWEREAKAAHRGLWASSNPEKPWEWRRDHPRRENAVIQVY